MNWTRRRSPGCRQGLRERLIPASGGSSSSCVPRGCVAVLVGEGDDEVPPERVVVDVRALGLPCVRALLEMAEREFGYDQKGVLRIPCAAEEFHRAVAADSSAAGGHQHRCRR